MNRDDGEDGRHGFRLHPNRLNTINLRYEENRARQPVTATSRAGLNERRPDAPPAPFDNDLFCPRCGADNRNWVQIQNRRKSIPLLASLNSEKHQQITIGLIVFILATTAAFLAYYGFLKPDLLVKQGLLLALGWVTASAVIMALLNVSGSFFSHVDVQHKALATAVTAVFTAVIAFVFVLLRAPNSGWQLAVPLGFTALVAGVLPAAAITSNWQKNLRQTREHRALPTRFHSAKRSQTLTGLTFLLLFTTFVPIVLYVVFPALFALMFEPPDKSPIFSVKSSIVEVQEKLEQWQLQEDAPDAANQSAIHLQEIVQQAEQKLLTNDEQLRELRKLIAQLENNKDIPPGLVSEIRENIDGLKQTETELKSFVDAQRKPDLLLPPDVSWQFYFLWLLFVGFNTVLSTLAGASVSTAFVNRVNAQLPPPIFHSVAAMTRVVVWEAKRALEVRGVIMDYVQWTAVQRNELGGITLTGLHRDQPGLQAPDAAIGQRVPAQLYTIKSNRWAAIVEANLFSTTAGPAPRVPDTGISRTFFANVDRQSYENIRP